jgi:hypothetical protein
LNRKLLIVLFVLSNIYAVEYKGKEYQYEAKSDNEYVQNICYLTQDNLEFSQDELLYNSHRYDYLGLKRLEQSILDKKRLLEKYCIGYIIQ